MKIGWQKHLKLNTDFIIEEPTSVFILSSKEGNQSFVVVAAGRLVLFEMVIGLLMFGAAESFELNGEKFEVE